MPLPDILALTGLALAALAVLGFIWLWFDMLWDTWRREGFIQSLPALALTLLAVGALLIFIAINLHEVG